MPSTSPSCSLNTIAFGHSIGIVKTPLPWCSLLLSPLSSSSAPSFTGTSDQLLAALSIFPIPRPYPFDLISPCPFVTLSRDSSPNRFDLRQSLLFIQIFPPSNTIEPLPGTPASSNRFFLPRIAIVISLLLPVPPLVIYDIREGSNMSR